MFSFFALEKTKETRAVDLLKSWVKKIKNFLGESKKEGEKKVCP